VELDGHNTVTTPRHDWYDECLSKGSWHGHEVRTFMQMANNFSHPCNHKVRLV